VDHSCELRQQFFVWGFLGFPIQIVLAISLPVLQVFPPVVGRKVAKESEERTISLVSLCSGKGFVNTLEEFGGG
jgi:hypothetical protein